MIRGLLKRKFVRDTLFMQATTLTQGATYFVTSVLLANYLGDYDLGRWEFSRTLFTFTFFLVTMGVGNATISRYSEAVARQDRSACIDALAMLLKLGLATSALAAGLGWWLLPVVAGWWAGDAHTGTLAWILCTVGLFEVLRTLGMAALVGARLMRVFAIFDVAANLLRVGLIWLAIAADLGLRGVAFAFSANLVVGGLLALWAYRIARRGDVKLAPPPLCDVLAAVPGASMRALTSVSFFLALNKGMNELVPAVGGFLIAGQSFQSTGVYSVAHKISWGLALLVGGVSRSFLPALGFRIGSSDVPFAQMGRTIKRASLASGLLFGALTTAVIPVVPWVLDTFYGAEFAGGYGLFLALIVGNYFIGFGVGIEPFYLFSGRLKVFTAFNLIWCAAWIAVTSSVAHAIGPMGIAVAVGLLRVFVVFHLVYIWRYFRRVRADVRHPPIPLP